MRSGAEALPLVGDVLAMARPHRPCLRPLADQVRTQFGPNGSRACSAGSAADAAVTFLVAPIGPTIADVEVMTAIDRAQTSMMRPPVGSHRAGVRKNDGVSNT